MSRAVRIAIIVAVVVALQAAAVLVYWQVERGRRARATFTATALPGSPAPSLTVERIDGSSLDVARGPGRVRLVHFWATWCEPCRTELPDLLARAAAADGVELIAVSVDEDWDVVRGFFPGGVPSEVVRARDREAHRGYGARALPDTYVMAADGRLVERIAGARDWATVAAREYLRDLPARRWSTSP